jgi:hypothetical protein
MFNYGHDYLTRQHEKVIAEQKDIHDKFQLERKEMEKLHYQQSEDDDL